MPPIEAVLQENVRLKERIAELEAQIAWFRRQIFAGGKSEKADPKQLNLLLRGLEEAAAELRCETVTYERKAKSGRRSREELYGDLPVREEKVVEPEEVESEPEAYERVGEEETFEVCVKPPSFYRRSRSAAPGGGDRLGRAALPRGRLEVSRPPSALPAMRDLQARRLPRPPREPGPLGREGGRMAQANLQPHAPRASRRRLPPG